MTIREAAIVSAYTGFLIGDFNDLHKYIEEIMGRPVWTQEMASEAFQAELRAKSKADFISMEVK